MEIDHIQHFLPKIEQRFNGKSANWNSIHGISLTYAHSKWSIDTKIIFSVPVTIFLRLTPSCDQSTKPTTIESRCLLRQSRGDKIQSIRHFWKPKHLHTCSVPIHYNSPNMLHDGVRSQWPTQVISVWEVRPLFHNWLVEPFYTASCFITIQNDDFHFSVGIYERMNRFWNMTVKVCTLSVQIIFN